MTKLKVNNLSAKYSFIIFITITIGILGFYFNLQYFWSMDKHPVTIAVSKTPLSTPFYVAKSINSFDETCVEVEYTEVKGGQIAFEKVMNGDVDFGPLLGVVRSWKLIVVLLHVFQRLCRLHQVII